MFAITFKKFPPNLNSIERSVVESSKQWKPLKFIYYEEYFDQLDAIKREKIFKGWPRKDDSNKKTKILFSRAGFKVSTVS
jgi:predicted GIY-YIG superfamily endonuclease